MSASLLLLAALGALAQPAPEAPPPARVTTERLLLDLETREAFTKRHAAAFVRVRFHPAAEGGEDPLFQPWLETLGTVVAGPDGAPEVLAPEHVLARVGRAELVLADERTVPARVVHAKDPSEAPLARLVPRDPEALAGVKPLAWAPEGALETGARGWGIEWPSLGQLPAGTTPRPVLVDTELGAEAEHPLERFRYVALKRADGLAVLDGQGQLLCIAYRAVLTLDALSLCTPEEAALAPFRGPAPPKPAPP